MSNIRLKLLIGTLWRISTMLCAFDKSKPMQGMFFEELPELSWQNTYFMDILMFGMWNSLKWRPLNN